MDKEQCLQTIRVLVSRFDQRRAEYIRANADYNETQLRTDFLNPFLVALGWDVFNEKQAPQHLREVVHEDTVEIEDGSAVLTKKPDYALRLGAERKCFIEAKRPSVNITTSNAAAFQIRRYGWNARLPISVLTNFDQLVIYDCRVRPQAEDEAHVARLKVYTYTDYVAKFGEIYAQLSREAVYTGSFDAQFSLVQDRAGAEAFDEYFLSQIETWRMQLAQDIAQQNPALTQAELNFLVQRLINRIIFLRICEDRDLERYQTLQAVQTYDELKALFRQADRRYNSGLFDFIEDQLSLNIAISNPVLIRIFQELYYPASPYAFSVLDAGILGEIYERFLGKQVVLADQQVTIADKDEVAASQGVVPTPKHEVEVIVKKTLNPLCEGKSPAELASLRLADISCGSGVFLVAAYEYLLNVYLEGYLREGVQQVFGQRRTTYTCILVLSQAATPGFTMEHVRDLAAWRRAEPGEIVEYPADYLTESPWEFVSPAARQVFDRLRAAYPTRLEEVANIFVGVQTSADKVYIIEPLDEWSMPVPATRAYGNPNKFGSPESSTC